MCRLQRRRLFGSQRIDFIKIQFIHQLVTSTPLSTSCPSYASTLLKSVSRPPSRYIECVSLAGSRLEIIHFYPQSKPCQRKKTICYSPSIIPHHLPTTQGTQSRQGLTSICNRPLEDNPSQCTKFCGGGVQLLSLCASALTLLAIASYSISPLFNFPLFISSRVLKATFSQPFIVDGSRAAMGPIGSTDSMLKCALKWRRSRGEFAAFRRILTSFATPTNFSRYRFPGKFCFIVLHVSGPHLNISLAKAWTLFSPSHT